eukprot:1217137-Rhodomonas_salina.1
MTCFEDGAACVACAVGWYKPLNGSGTCITCEAGTYLTVMGGRLVGIMCWVLCWYLHERDCILGVLGLPSGCQIALAGGE